MSAQQFLDTVSANTCDISIKYQYTNAFYSFSSLRCILNLLNKDPSWTGMLIIITNIYGRISSGLCTGHVDCYVDHDDIGAGRGQTFHDF